VIFRLSWPARWSSRSARGREPVVSSVRAALSFGSGPEPNRRSHERRLIMITVIGQWISSRNDRNLTNQELDILKKLDPNSKTARDLSG